MTFLRGVSSKRAVIEHVRSLFRCYSRAAWKAAGHPGNPTTVVRMPTLVAATQAEAQRLTENRMRLARRYYAGRAGIGSTDAGSASPETAADANLFGTPEEVVERIHVLRENFSADESMFEVNWTASVPRNVVMNTLRLMTDTVIPQCKEHGRPMMGMVWRRRAAPHHRAQWATVTG
jgi:alkanesulfonate monooxygenase SsuD/methylene tetrahydromethanopterin reductase-like flavin-dependent oxidoreductase (luciferase family)